MLPFGPQSMPECPDSDRARGGGLQDNALSWAIPLARLELRPAREVAAELDKLAAGRVTEVF